MENVLDGFNPIAVEDKALQSDVSAQAVDHCQLVLG